MLAMALASISRAPAAFAAGAPPVVDNAAHINSAAADAAKRRTFADRADT
ncbi:uncharacterized protein RMCN_1807 [Mycolicibacterium novocastrense]|uniref:Uncharacterized protein n=1 Tax=Mycolicibacterium novocastrense TaxID=59813 RepID=A0ABQ0KH71_MYCNV|nr:uncharacterized protein RMCN_1807 [Mycolicibacterium novocastrense]